MISRLAVIGVGLIGGSLAMGLRRAAQVEEIVGCGRSTENLATAVKLGIIDRYTHDVAEAVDGADMVLVAVPLGAMPGVFAAMRDHLADNTVITDAGSSKAIVVAAAEQELGDAFARFVPGHPIAGTEQSGAEAAFATLYKDRRVILTPVPDTDEQAISRVQSMWEHCGAVVTSMDVEHHDEVLAATSHLPHMLAFGLVDALAGLEEHDEIFQYAAGGFRDFTRIASSNPVMWRDICLANKNALLKMMAVYSNEMQSLTKVIEDEDGDRLLEIFERAKQARDQYVDSVVKKDE